MQNEDSQKVPECFEPRPALKHEVTAIMDHHQERALAASKVPRHLMQALTRYEHKRIHPGGALTALLVCDWTEFDFLADPECQDNFVHIENWVHNYMPNVCWGSQFAVDSWLAGSNS